MLASIGALVQTDLVPLSPETAASLASAYLNRANIHDLCCASPCACGVSTLLTDLVDALLPGFADAAKSLGLEGKPFWPADYPGLLRVDAPVATTI